MIPKIIHYCWFGHGEKPELVQRCMASWHQFMPAIGEKASEREGEWEYREWSEDNFDITSAPLYVRQAYEARKFAFVSDYVRLWALEQYGGVYLDTDVEVIRSYEQLLNDTSFMGFEENKAKALGTNVIGCEPHCPWVKEMLVYYQRTAFIKNDGSFDITANSELIARFMEGKGLVRNGVEQVVDGLHVYDFHYFSPITSTRVVRKNKNTFSIHHCYGSWVEGSKGNRLRNSVIVREVMNAMIQFKRLIVG